MNAFKTLLEEAESKDPGISELWSLVLNQQMTTNPIDSPRAAQRLIEVIEKQIKSESQAGQVKAQSDLE